MAEESKKEVTPEKVEEVPEKEVKESSKEEVTPEKVEEKHEELKADIKKDEEIDAEVQELINNFDTQKATDSLKKWHLEHRAKDEYQKLNANRLEKHLAEGRNLQDFFKKLEKEVSQRPDVFTIGEDVNVSKMIPEGAQIKDTKTPQKGNGIYEK
jgi:hypothetical protein